MTVARVGWGAFVLAWSAGCSTEELGPPRFPADFMTTYREMRDCRHSHEHELRHIRVFASPTATAAYAALSPDVPYPPGAMLVKLEYELPGCNDDELVQTTVLEKLDGGLGKWLWQRVDVDRITREEGPNLHRCVSCHAVHCAPPKGWDLTCAEEL